MGRDWDEHVAQAEELARSEGFERLRDEIVRLAQPEADDVVVDVGSGTGLLALALAPSVSKVWAVDISGAMLEYLTTKAASGELDNVGPVSANAVRLPLVDGSASLVVSNYCFHHLSDADKERGIAEIFRVLRPGGRVVIGDMMFRVQIADPRNRRLIASKIRSMLRRGPTGLLRVIKNAVRLVTGRWEQPADAHWWRRALQRAGFTDIEIRLLEHEGGLISARRPDRRVRPWHRRSTHRSAVAKGLGAAGDALPEGYGRAHPGEGQATPASSP